MASDRTYFVLSRAERSSITSGFDTPVESTNLKCDVGNTEDSLCDRIELSDVNILLVPIQAELTSANTAPSLIPFSKFLSVDLLISGVNPFINLSSSWTDERSDSVYADIVSWLRCFVVK
jgi:hypothetical protein